MNEVSRRALCWAPRALCILLIAFVSIFALDVFQEGRGFWQTLVALVMHLIPTFVMLAALAISWRWEWAGSLIFGAGGLFFLSTVRGTTGTKLIFAMPCFLAAVMFLAGWRFKTRKGRA